MTELRRNPIFPDIPDSFQGDQRKWAEGMLDFQKKHIHGDYDDFVDHHTRHESGGDDEVTIGEIQDIPVDAPVAGDDNKVLFYDHTNTKFDYISPGGGITLFPWFRDSVGQGTWAFTADGNQVYSGYYWNNPAVDGDNFSWKCYLAAGTYTIKAIGMKSTDRGITDIDIDGTEVASFDWYDASGIYNHIPTPDTGNVITTSGVKTIRLRVDGKHASSSDYYILISALNLYRTS